MKTLSQKLIVLTTLLFVVISYGCQKDELDFADESTIVNTYPSISVYKTKSDYFNYISLQLLPDGRLNAIPSYNLEDSRISVGEKGKIKINTRWKLVSGYVVDSEPEIQNPVFTNITFQEYVDYNTKNGVTCMPNELIKERVIDTDPYLDFYYKEYDPETPDLTLGDINKMIESGTIEDYFEKLK